MPENIMPDNDLQQLATLYTIRADMQRFCRNEDDEFARFGVLSACDNLLEDSDNLRTKINAAVEEYVLQRLAVGNFDYSQYKTTSDKEDKERRRDTKGSKEQNAKTALIRKQLSEEIAFQVSKKPELKGIENAEILSVCFEDNLFKIKLAGRKEPLELKHYTRKGRKELHFSSLGCTFLGTSKPQKVGIDNKGYELIVAAGKDGFVLEELDKPQDLGKKYAPAEYRAFLGMPRSSELSARQKKELEFLNKLTISDQASFLTALKKRTVLLKQYKEITDFITDTEDKLGLLVEPEKLQDLLKKNGVEDFVPALQKQFIHTIQKNKEIWNNFSKTDEEKNSNRFSRYEVLQNNIIARNTELFAEVYNADFNDKTDIQKKITACFSKVRRLSEVSLPDGLCAEIISLGIFKEAMRNGVDEEKLSKMNKLLNEFNLNVEFKPLPITQAPTEEISNAAEQTKIDRQNFEQLKRGETYLSEERKFADELKKYNVKKADHTSTHHYIALKYNPFVEAELNDNTLLVKTARINAWNYDGHDTSHLFDTAGEFLVANDRGEYFFADFNNLRNRFKNGENMQIQAPILQVSDGKGAFRDLLALGENGASGQYISDNSTSQIMSVPEYCRSENFQFALTLKKKKAKSEKKA